MINIEERDGKVYVSMTRGDTLLADITIYRPDGTIYTPQTGDYIRFAMKRSYKSDRVLINKEINIYSLMLVLDPADTKNLDFGTYVFDIQLDMLDGTVDTFIKGVFELTPEVE